MNRIIIIGNGFDRAHNLRTGYKEFIDDYWSGLFNQITDVSGQLIVKSYCDTFVSFNIINPDALIYSRSPFAIIKPKSYNEFIDYINQSNDRYASKKYEFRFENKFFGHISEQCSLKNWLDIENEYYEMLKKILTDEASSKRNEKVKKLNDEWDAVKMLLEEHLTLVTKNNDMEKHQSIQEAFSSPVELDDIATCKQHEFLNSVFFKYDLDGDIYLYEDYKNKEHEYDGHNTEDQIRRNFIEQNIKKEFFKKEYCKPNTLLLNFNYTKTAENLYIKEDMYFDIVNIHGELNNEDNPIIFGYGDELDEDYQKIEKTQDNDFLENIKSIKYHQTCNYRDLLKFIESGIYQVFVMGHSCGNSDRTLLNTLFEHNNCASIKVFYWQPEEGKDDYSNLIRNISRNFNDKPKMRDIVVNRKNCLPLVPFNEKALLEEQNIHTVSKFIRIQ
ncbi:MAG TPA: AbiH family protein [Macellibacteroides fermentans]|uniref:AbiH family protein n=1 Tax=Macellibacteroides fermentans TaxID=879969 RepID=UPI002C54E7C9|nr:AbiH family protein [Macellibacteroides fermentans]